MACLLGKKRVALFCAVSLVVGAASAAITSRSYVQGGLVAQYDGIDNAGRGVHDASAKVWKDLTGNGNDAIKATNVTWAANGWENGASCKPMYVGSGLAAVTATKTFTAEFACTPSRTDTRECFFSQYNQTGVCIEHNSSSGNKSGGFLRYYVNSSPDTHNWNAHDMKILADEWASISLASTPTNQMFCKNGTESLGTNIDLSGSLVNTCPSVIGGCPNRDNMAFYGKYNAFRLYDRALSEDEAKVNAAVDAIRFNGANPGDFTLGGGWSFDGNGDLCVAVTATASGNGSVSGSATVKQYGTATLTATPASGAVFKYWTGDTDIISSGSIYDATVTVTPTDPCMLVAVFKAPKASSFLYVQDGLVAGYDGIDNAGTGTHDSSATTWKNLAGDALLDGTMGALTEWTGGKGWRTTGNTKPFTVAAPGLSSTFATTNFTMQFACVPAVANKRMCYFGQYANPDGINIEQTTVGKLRFYRNASSSQSSTHDKTVSTATVVANTYLSTAVCVSQTGLTFYNGGTLLQTIDGNPGAITSTSASVIGGELQDGSKRTSLDATYGITFRGTYHAFRVYNVTLTAAEIAWNAGLDAVRFNGADAAATLGDGYSYDAATDTLTATVSATATAGGKVSYRGGAASSSAGGSFACDDTTVAALAALPDEGYVFDRWTGDTSFIASGSTLTPEIVLAPDRAATLVANFRRNGDADDGKVFDLSFTGDATADGMTFSTTEAEEKQGYVTADIPLPVLPTVTNANISCLSLPQPTNAAGTGVYRQMAVSDKPSVTGEVATVFVRFRWDGPVLPTVANYPDVLLNGYTSWYATGRGFIVRLFSAANSTDAYPGFVFPQHVVDGNSSNIENVSGNGIVKPGEWIDLFASVYPSPTNPSLSNADIWYCRVPSWNSGGYFAAPVIGHRHYGDVLKIPRMDTTSTILQFGTEPGNSKGAATDANKAKCFRGAIACAKGWNRLLSEDERFTVMAGFGGVQTFNNAEIGTGRSVKTGNLSTMQGRNVTGTAFLGDADTAHFQRALSSNRPYNTIKLIFDAPKGDRIYPFVYKTTISDVKSGNVHPVHLDFNGKTVWSSEDVAKGTEIRVELNEADALPGINELTWHYDTPIADNWVLFRFHQLRLGIDGMIIRIR